MAAAQDHDEHDGTFHVHFSEEQIQEHNSEIVVKYQSQDRVDLYLGFLQVHHHYEIKVSIEDSLSEDLTSDPLQNVNVKVAKVSPSENGKGHDLCIDFLAWKEKIMTEELLLSESTNNQRKLKVVLHARVLGKGKGTPALKSGIHCSGVDPEYDSEQSDWQGFD